MIRNLDPKWRPDPDSATLCHADARADYSMLRGVHEHWLFSRRQRFLRVLTERLMNRRGADLAWPDLLFAYQPGDYFDAAIRVADEWQASREHAAANSASR